MALTPNRQKHHTKKQKQAEVTAIVPAYNEEGRIGDVLSAIEEYPGFAEVIVVDDGSTDNTAAVAARYNVRVVQQKPNQGKAQAMDRGVREAQTDIIFFCDADMRGFTHAMLDDIIEPVRSGRVDMSVAVHNRRLYWLSFVLIFIPVLGGQRALRKALWQTLPSFYKKGFRIETGLNFFARYYGKDYQLKVFKNLHHSIKEQKHGLFTGFKQRLKMIGHIIVAQLALGLFHSPAVVRHRRKLAFETIWNIIGVAIGFLLLLVAYWGPRQFVLDIFAERLTKRPDAPLINIWLYLAGVVSIETVLVIGLGLLTVNVFVLLLNFRTVLTMYRNVFFRRKAAVRE